MSIWILGMSRSRPHRRQSLKPQRYFCVLTVGSCGTLSSQLQEGQLLDQKLWRKYGSRSWGGFVGAALPVGQQARRIIRCALIHDSLWSPVWSKPAQLRVSQLRACQSPALGLCKWKFPERKDSHLFLKDSTRLSDWLEFYGCVELNVTRLRAKLSLAFLSSLNNSWSNPVSDLLALIIGWKLWNVFLGN